MSIPKKIHYCWFGGNPLPESALKCIASWKKYCPDYEIIEWNESNFDVNCCNYTKEAYEAQKWAFVSDYARFWILYREGGIYFDTDVEVLKPIDDIINKGAFMGCETLDRCAPGLGLGVNPGLSIFKEIIDFYQTRHFLKLNGEPDTTTVVDYTTEILMKHGWIPNGKNQTVCGITIYIPEYFCPMDYETGRINITNNTYTIHHYSASWHNEDEKLLRKMINKYTRIFGKSIGRKVAAVGFSLQKYGLRDTIKKIVYHKNKTQMLCF